MPDCSERCLGNRLVLLALLPVKCQCPKCHLCLMFRRLPSPPGAPSTFAQRRRRRLKPLVRWHQRPRCMPPHLAALNHFIEDQDHGQLGSVSTNDTHVWWFILTYISAERNQLTPPLVEPTMMVPGAVGLFGAPSDSSMYEQHR